MRKFLIRDSQGIEKVFSLHEILAEINRDRSEEWSTYDETDWMEGLKHFTDLEFVKEVSNG